MFVFVVVQWLFGISNFVIGFLDPSLYYVIGDLQDKCVTLSCNWRHIDTNNNLRK